MKRSLLAVVAVLVVGCGGAQGGRSIDVLWIQPAPETRLDADARLFGGRLLAHECRDVPVAGAAMALAGNYADLKVTAQTDSAGGLVLSFCNTSPHDYQ